MEELGKQQRPDRAHSSLASLVKVEKRKKHLWTMSLAIIEHGLKYLTIFQRYCTKDFFFSISLLFSVTMTMENCFIKVDEAVG